MKDVEHAARFIEEALSIEAAEAKEAGHLGYYARMLVQVTMPHSQPSSNEYKRRNGPLTLTMMAPSDIGLPYGTYPRLLLAFITTEAVRQKSRELELGDSLSAFMRRLDLDVTGGKKGTVTVLRRQMRRLFRSTIEWSYERDGMEAGGGIRPVEKSCL